MVPDLRLLRSRNAAGVEQAFITDRFDLTAFELVRLYHDRWQIELCFRFLKQHLGLVPVLGRSRAAVWLSMLLAVIIALLAVVIAGDRPAAISSIAWLRAVGQALQASRRSG